MFMAMMGVWEMRVRVGQACMLMLMTMWLARRERFFVERFAALQERLESQFAEGQRLEQSIRDKLRQLVPPGD